MSDLLQTYRSLPVGQKAVVGGVTVVAAIVVLFSLPHILGAVIAFSLAVVSLAFAAAALIVLGAAAYLVVRWMLSRV